MRRFKKFSLVVIAVFLTLLASPARSDEDLVLSWEQMQKLDPGRKVSLLKITDDGEFLMISGEKGKQEEVRILVVARRGWLKRTLSMPVKGVEYAASNPAGRKVMVYSPHLRSFYLGDTWRKKWKLIFRRKSTVRGFALFEGSSSKLAFSGEDIFARGFWYDGAGDYLEESIVQILPGEKGQKIFKTLFSAGQMKQIARDFFPGAEHVDFVGANKNYLILILKRGVRSCLVVYDRQKKDYYKIGEFDEFSGADLARDSSRLVYAVRPRGSSFSGVLFFYDLKKAVPIKAVPGNFFNPVFDPDSRRVAACRIKEVNRRVVGSEIVVFPFSGDTREPGKIKMDPGIRPVDWRFTGAREITYFTGRDIYRKVYY